MIDYSIPLILQDPRITGRNDKTALERELAAALRDVLSAIRDDPFSIGNPALAKAVIAAKATLAKAEAA